MVNEIANETGCSMVSCHTHTYTHTHSGQSVPHSSSFCPQDEQLLLESKLLLATQPPICLEPSTEVVWVTNRLHYNRYIHGLINYSSSVSGMYSRGI